MKTIKELEAKLFDAQVNRDAYAKQLAEVQKRYDHYVQEYWNTVDSIEYVKAEKNNTLEYKLIIYKYAYLKTPLYKWVLVNNLGGEFSNSGQFNSEYKALAHAKANNLGHDFEKLPKEMRIIDGTESEGDL